MKKQQEWKTQANWKDRNWKYVNAASTNIEKTFARVRKEMEQLKQNGR
jgi:hypothetical protein